MNLPDELLLGIFEYFDWKTLIQLRGVSQNFFRISTDWYLVKNFIKDDSSKDDLNPIGKKSLEIGYTMFNNYLKVRKPTKGDFLVRSICERQNRAKKLKTKLYYNRLVKIAINNGADPNDGLPLQEALKGNYNEAAVGLLLAEGADPNLIPNIFKDYLDDHHNTYFKMLLMHGLDPNKENERSHPLISILRRGDSEYNERWNVFKMLIKLGADPNITNSYNRSALSIFFDCAKRWTYPMEVLKLLLEAGADIKALKGIHSPLFIMFYNGHYSWENPMKVIKFLINLCPDSLQFVLNYRNQDNTIKYRLLTDIGPYRLKSSNRYDYLIDNNRCKLVRFLLKNGYDISDGRGLLGQNPLHWAVKYRKPKLVRLFLHYGIDPNVQDSDLNTPLHMIKLNKTIDMVYSYAKMTRDNAKEIINILLQIGANPEIKNSDSETAKDIIIHFLQCDCMYQKLI